MIALSKRHLTSSQITYIQAIYSISDFFVTEEKEERCHSLSVTSTVCASWIQTMLSCSTASSPGLPPRVWPTVQCDTFRQFVCSFASRGPSHFGFESCHLVESGLALELGVLSALRHVWHWGGSRGWKTSGGAQFSDYNYAFIPTVVV